MSETAEIHGFKRCEVCGKSWLVRSDLLSDPGVGLVGYQVNFADLVMGLLLFEHSCGTTLAIGVLEFRDLYSGPIFQSRRTGESDCPTYCLHAEELRPCPATCECAFVREILQIIRQWPKEPVRAQVNF